ncbi:hexamerin-1.1-like [Toxorhynchites rutilus septentrionalis]|uniref:hexamerin-1.1-like n=1 Tax=Toxorhynchites rutilus septentrionalis TaxID=329112 RepID=UPI00247891A1|nr:hexamerin-1.1-like [Toxorhynchites rutilus septentrionalis]
MKAITLVALVAFAALAAGYVVVPDDKIKYADKNFLVKQRQLLELFQHVQQHEVHNEQWNVAKQYKIQDNYDHYKNADAVKEFFQMYRHGMLQMDDTFSIFHEHHREQAIALFHVFYYANDWDTFYKSVAWARFHVNEGLWIYATTVALLHRNDMAGLELPAPYEIYPNYFFNSEVIQRATQYKMQGFYGTKKVDDVYSVVIPANYTGWYVHTNPDQKVSYYTEDIGLNTYYYYFNADYPFWMGGKEYGLYKDRRGELYLFKHQQLLARYYLERLSNDLGAIPEFSWYKPIRTGYYPDMHYYNGQNFPARDNYYNIYTADNYNQIDEMVDIEHRIREAIDQGYVTLQDGSHIDLTRPESVEYLGNLIQGNPDSVNNRYYKYVGHIARNLLGASMDHLDTHKVIPGVLEHYETSLRDPMFYQMYKRIMHWYWEFKNHLQHYTYDELNFPGVKIESVDVDKLVTYFDRFDADITNAVDVEVQDDTNIEGNNLRKTGRITHHQGEGFLIKARQWRLNHMPFNLKLNVYADKAQRAVVRVYLGPKYNQYGHVYGINENRKNFVLLDVFQTELANGKNTIVRDSSQFSLYVQDRTSYYDLYKWVMAATNGEKKFPLDMTEAHCGFPSRLMLPKGKKGGMAYQLYFIVSPYHAPNTPQHQGYDYTINCGVGTGARYVDSLPFGYPFDRQIDEKFWFTPNMYYYDTLIYNKNEKEINAVH